MPTPYYCKKQQPIILSTKQHLC